MRTLSIQVILGSSGNYGGAHKSINKCTNYSFDWTGAAQKKQLERRITCDPPFSNTAAKIRYLIIILSSV